MNDLTKIGLATGMAILLVLGMIFKNKPGSHSPGTEARQALAESNQQVVSLRTELEQSSAGNEKTIATLRTELSQLNESRNALSGALESARAELSDLKANQQPADNTEDAQRQVATLQLEVEGLRAKLATSEATSQEMITGLNARLRAQNTATQSAGSAQLLSQVQGLQAKVSQADLQIAQSREDAEQARTSFDEQLASVTMQRDEMAGELELVAQQMQAQEKSMADQQSEVSRLQTDLKAAEGALDEATAERDSLLGRVAQLKQSTEGSQSASDKLTEKVRELEARAEALQAQTGDLETARDGLQTKLDDTVAELESARTEIKTLSAEQTRLNSAIADARTQGKPDSSVNEGTAKLIAALSNRFAVAGIDGVKIYERSGGIVSVRAGNSEVFSPGGTAISAEGREILAEVGSVLAAMPDSRLQIEGHTDNIPIGPVMSGLYGSNWDLSVARAMAAVRHLERRVGIGADRLSGAGFGEFMPVATNDTAEGRSLNRRIEIVVYPVEQTPN